NLWQFGRENQEVMGQHLPFHYLSYGCYCGWGGIEPKCCYVHDCCYGKLDLYTYSKETGDLVCGGDDPCQKQLCECDRVAALCFQDNKDTYDQKPYNAENCQEASEAC
uniref:Acidic phospholipase A2 2 (Fragments) n=1 Tax=Bothrops insularis TaxID=8723 RepID=PA2A2_BOTIN|nr:RecName: Full=Acidic phospholipase A2 2; Short=svPLA2; AltName: Full=BinTX-II; AltName: Full=Phosphatidylcholine 2-acylhydrolase [Bothrops insularis]